MITWQIFSLSLYLLKGMVNLPSLCLVWAKHVDAMLMGVFAQVAEFPLNSTALAGGIWYACREEC